MKLFLKQYGVWILQSVTLLLILLNSLWVKNYLHETLNGYVSNIQFVEWRTSHEKWETSTFNEIKDHLTDSNRKLDLIILQHTNIKP